MCTIIVFDLKLHLQRIVKQHDNCSTSHPSFVRRELFQNFLACSFHQNSFKMTGTLFNVPPPPNDDIQDGIFDIECDWLRCLATVQRKVLLKTVRANCHEQCAHITGNVGGVPGIFRCFHGKKFQTTSPSSNSSRRPLTNRDSRQLSNHVTGRISFHRKSSRRESSNISHESGSSSNSHYSYRYSEDSFDCPICLQTVPKRQGFAFGDYKHTMCHECTKNTLLTWNHRNGEHVYCPICRSSLNMQSYVEGFCVAHSQRVRR